MSARVPLRAFRPRFTQALSVQRQTLITTLQVLYAEAKGKPRDPVGRGEVRSVRPPGFEAAEAYALAQLSSAVQACEEPAAGA